MTFGNTESRFPEAQLRTPHWYALRTRARTERRAGLRLHDRGFDVFTATARMERQWSDRVQRVELPLFPGYIFARFALTEITEVLGTPGVAGVVRSEGVPQPVRDDEMESVRSLASGVDRTGTAPEPIDPLDLLDAGDEIRILSGPFEGMRGVLLDGPDGRTRMAVKVHAIRQARAVVLDRAHLKPAPGHRPERRGRQTR